MKRLFKKGLSVLLAVCMMFCGLTVPVAAVDLLDGYVTISANSLKTTDTPTVTVNLKGIPYTAKTVPNDVILVIDRSGSMIDDIGNMIDAAKDFVSAVDTSVHRIGIVAYESGVQTLSLTNNKTDLKNFLDSVNSTAGSTAMHSGINTAAAELAANMRTDAIGSIVLMTDGIADSIANAKTAAANAKAAGYFFYTVALCDSLNSQANIDLMEMATSETDHYSVFESSLLSQAYDDIAQKIGDCNALNVVVTQEIDSNFELVAGSTDSNIPKPTINGNVLTWEIPQLSAGLSTLSYKIKPVSGIADGTYTHGTGTVEYVDHTGATRVVDLNELIIMVRPNAPKITAITPQLHDGKTDVDVTLTGTDFNADAKVYFDGTEVTPKSISASSITFTVPACDYDDYDVIVKNPDGQSSKITMYIAPDPIITSVTPDSCDENDTAKVTINGQNFNGSASTLKVYVGNTAAKVNACNTTKIVCTVPALAEGVYDITVVNANTGRATMAGAFTYLGEPPIVPTITKLSIARIPQNKSKELRITGTNFDGGAAIKVLVGGEEAEVSAANSTTILCTLPAMAAGVYDITVINQDGTSGTMANAITYYAPTTPAPVIKTVNVSSVTVSKATSTKITVTGNYFGSKTQIKVYVNGVEAKIYAANTTKIIFYPPALPAGTYDVKVENADGLVGTWSKTLTYK